MEVATAAPGAENAGAGLDPTPEKKYVARMLLLVSTRLNAPRRTPANCGVNCIATVQEFAGAPVQVVALEISVKSGFANELLGTPSVNTTGVPRVTPPGTGTARSFAPTVTTGDGRLR